MIPAFRISDAIRGVVFHELKGSNLACVRSACPSDVGSGFPALRSVSFWTNAMLQRQDRVTQVCRNGSRLRAAGSARRLGGPKAWEIDRLYLCESESVGRLEEEVFPSLLDSLVQSARERGAQRVFLRCSLDSEVANMAKRSGFVHYFNEVVLEGSGPVGISEATAGGYKTGLEPTPVLIRDRLPQDTHALFQLFSAATPQQVRVGLGFTLDQWRDSQEPAPSREWVAAHEDRLAAWGGLWADGKRSHGEVMIHPDHPELLPVMLGRILAQPGPKRLVVPDYQGTTLELLHRRGFRETAEYAITASTVAAVEYSHSMATVEA